MKTSALIPVVAYLGLAGFASAAPVAVEAEHSLDKRTFCFFGFGWGCSTPTTTSAAPAKTSAVASSSVKAAVVTSSSAAVKSSAVPSVAASSAKAAVSSAAASASSAKAVVSSAAASKVSAASWAQCTDFNWDSWGSDWTWGGGYDKTYVQKWYADQYGYAPPPGMNWRQVTSLVNKFGAQTKPATPKTTSKYTGKGCGNPWTSAAPATKTQGAVTTAKPVSTSAAASSVKPSVSSAQASASASASKASSAVVASSSASASKSVAPASSSAAAVSSASSVVAQPAASSASSVVAQPAASSASSVVAQPAASSASSVVAQPAASSASSVVAQPAASSSAAVDSGAAAGTPSSASASPAGPSPTSGTSDGSAGVPGTGSGVPGTGAGSNNATGTTVPDVPAPSASSPVTINGYTAGGCAQEVSGRLLDKVQTSSASQTIESCTALCASYGFGVAGLEYGNECYCGTLDDVQDALVSGECYMPCAGNANEICGGPNAINWYYDADLAPPTVELPAGWSTYGVVTEGNNGRLLSTLLYSSQDNTVETCAKGCAAAGYKVAGTEYSSECFCGNGFLASADGGDLVDDSAAFMACSGNLAQKCGGPSILSITSAFGNSIPTI